MIGMAMELVDGIAPKLYRYLIFGLFGGNEIMKKADPYTDTGEQKLRLQVKSPAFDLECCPVRYRYIFFQWFF